MTETQSPADDSTDEDLDQYDTLLRAMEEGLLISLNNGTDHGTPTGELRVKWSYDDKTDVSVSGFSERDYRIHRDRNGDLIYSKVTEDGLSYEDEVITIEVLGLDS